MRLFSVLAYGLALFFLCAVAFVFNSYNIPPALFLRDVAAISGRSPFLGLGSNLGAFALLVTSTVTLFSALLLKDIGRSYKLLLWLGLFSLLLFMDDFFMLHEKKFFIGIQEDYVFVLYSIFFALISMVMFRSSIDFDFRTLLASVIFFALSISIDIVQSFWDSPWRIFLEDGFKFVGIVSWSIFLIQASYLSVRGACHTSHGS
ncbi:MAG: hypothetical protein GVY04_00370 [Cyanobacteria bacterium]|jgi:hypothetical protein|nr:hypothetical protein [Cyanobacteria bacterium GSL.Bin1]